MAKKHFFLCLFLILAAAVSLQAQFTVLHEFAGSPDAGGAYGAFIKKGAALYGMTPWGGVNDYGTIFKINANGTGYKLLHSFDPASVTDGSTPYGSLLFNGGKLYGMTEYGGANSLGVIFRINLDGSGFTLLHSFAGGAMDGAVPVGSLIFVGGQLYGVTCRGGASDEGTIFRLSPKGTGFTVLHAFSSSGSDGYYPHGSLKAIGKTLYGMTSAGGTDDLGTIFRIGTTGTGYALLHSFANSETNGNTPNLGTLVAKGKTLYGMTSPNPHFPPGAGYGTIFKINTDGKGFGILHTFALGSMDGDTPYGSLTLSGSQIFGMACNGGTGENGTIFRIGVTGTGFTVLYAFDSDNGAKPKGDLLIRGKIAYGMTDYGGASDWGVIFSYKIK